MIGRTTLGLAAAGLVLTAAAAIPVLELGLPDARYAAGDWIEIEVEEPGTEALALPATDDEWTRAVRLEPRPWPMPRHRPREPRGALAVALTQVPPAPAPVAEPTPPTLAKAPVPAAELEVPELQAVEPPVPAPAARAPSAPRPGCWT